MIWQSKAAQLIAAVVAIFSFIAVLGGFINYFNHGTATHVLLIAVGLAGLIAIVCILYYFQVRLAEKHRRLFDSVPAVDDELSESSTAIQPGESKNLPM